MTKRMLLINAHLLGSADLFSIDIQAGKITSVKNMVDTTLRGSESFDLDGTFVLPGLWDSHLHFELLTQRLHAINCETDTKQTCLDAVQKAVQTNDSDNWLIGFNWNHNILCLENLIPYFIQ